ncbi:hypothetical protein GF389_03130 [Candidatus Dojkabacteria bacterium]|nr:hypothetical protein [Candidatus Dojkabacteria bacterium]
MQKTTKYFVLDSADKKKNRLEYENFLRETEVSEELKEEVENLLNFPSQIRTLGLFKTECEGEKELERISKLHFEYNIEIKGNMFYILPEQDFRQNLLQDTYLLNFSEKILELYKIGLEGMEKIPFDKVGTLEEKLGRMEESKSTQRRGHEFANFHGQGAQDMKERDTNHLINHAREVANALEGLLARTNSKLVIASTRRNFDILNSNLQERYRFPISLIGNHEQLKANQIFEKLLKEIDANASLFTENLAERLDVSESNRLQEKSFVEIVSVAKDAKIEKMFVGKLAPDVDDYENPVAPQGANYIAHEVLKWGGEVEYYKDLEFDFSENNLAFKFR